MSRETTREWMKSIEKELKKIKGKPEYNYTRFKKRDDAILKHAPDRRCPLCKEFQLSSANWVLNEKSSDPLVCKRCFHNPERLKPKQLVGPHLIKAVEKTYQLDGPKLRYMRQRAGMSQQVFSECVDISKSYLSQIENNKVAVSESTFERILSALEGSGVTTLDRVASDGPVEAPGGASDARHPAP